MTYTDGSFSPWKGTQHKRLMDISTQFLRWAIAERPEMVDRYPGLREYIATRTGATGVVRSDTREAKPARPAREKCPGNPARLPARKPQETPRRNPAPTGDLFALAASMREALK